MIDLYFLTVNYNSSSLVARLVESLFKNSDDKYRLVIVNNSPEDKNIFKLENKRIEIIEAKENVGFGRACNLGLQWIYRQNSQAIVWLINPDAYFNADIVEAEISQISSAMSPTSFAIAFFQNHPQISILGTTVYNSEGKITAAGGTFTPGTAALTIINSLPENLQQDYLKTDWVSGCSLLINLANFEECPNFDPRYFLYYEDLDFCLRYGQRHKIAITPLLKVFHDTSSITDRNTLQKYRHITKSYLIHIEKHGDLTTFISTNIRMSLNTIRLLLFKPQQGVGKLIGIYEYWHTRLLP